ncbi:MAG: methylenetetrahydrofolate--tRNA-(uracil(54)-C(5))-methyltransferase (FADH(2)-oxidizing) TrmFO [Deferribacteraceae bacterium]|jgi:methylenetetrahydrofolate--tRNA-(uracil-5-)-methyltransferase|nr:methylenetetrahydrofolate--tRNA-(uracil(54)-C(5))-methyltransferase (FADH(2)-oxidizing) TrmFO [Deferribacteraceae bacterium]
MDKIDIIGGGLAGCEAAHYLSKRGFNVNLFEMRPNRYSGAHTTDLLGELVCSNSLKSEQLDSAAGLLKAELRLMDSFFMRIAELSRVRAGSALAVDRLIFAKLATEEITRDPNITLIRKVVEEVGENFTIAATGPLSDETLLHKLFKDETLHFVDAISPVIAADSINFDLAFFADRYAKAEADYLNLPLNKSEFELFYDALIHADRATPHPFEDEAVFERCMPIESLAARGRETLLYGPMKPVGFKDYFPETLYAVVQLRAENQERTAYNIVGFQTRLKQQDQREVLRLIPALTQAEILRYGSIHRNSYINAPDILNHQRLNDKVFIAGQLAGVEGYLESMAAGISAAMEAEAVIKKLPVVNFPHLTAFGALQRHLAGEFADKYQPGSFHFGMLPHEKIKGRAERKKFYYSRAVEAMKKFIGA